MRAARAAANAVQFVNPSRFAPWLSWIVARRCRLSNAASKSGSAAIARAFASMTVKRDSWQWQSTYSAFSLGSMTLTPARSVLHGPGVMFGLFILLLVCCFVALCSSRCRLPVCREGGGAGYFLIIQNGLSDVRNVVHPLAFAHFKNGMTDSNKGEICSPVLWLSPIKSHVPILPVSG